MAHAVKEISQSRLRELFDYNEDTGIFTRKVRTSPNTHPGDIAGNTTSRGYQVIRIDGITYRAHRLAWTYVFGSCPPILDHKNRNKLDNRIANLRPVTDEENRHNVGLQKNNRFGCPGVYYRQRGCFWIARITSGGLRISLGFFKTKEEAAKAYATAKEQFYPQPQ